MKPLSPVPPTPPRADQAFPPKENVLSSDNSTKHTSTSSEPPQVDIVSFSTSSQEVSHYLEHMSQIPDVREARISNIQRALDSNSYTISSENIADKLLREIHSQPLEIKPPGAS